MNFKKKVEQRYNITSESYIFPLGYMWYDECMNKKQTNKFSILTNNNIVLWDVIATVQAPLSNSNSLFTPLLFTVSLKFLVCCSLGFRGGNCTSKLYGLGNEPREKQINKGAECRKCWCLLRGFEINGIHFASKLSHYNTETKSQSAVWLANKSRSISL